MVRGRRELGEGRGEGKTQYLDTKASGELHAQWGPEEFALYLEPVTAILNSRDRKSVV